jgi:hypothetical protein
MYETFHNRSSLQSCYKHFVNAVAQMLKGRVLFQRCRIVFSIHKKAKFADVLIKHHAMKMYVGASSIREMCTKITKYSNSKLFHKFRNNVQLQNA